MPDIAYHRVPYPWYEEKKEKFIFWWLRHKMGCWQFPTDFLNFDNICHVILKKTQPAITCSKLTIETLEQGVKYVQS